MAESKQAIKNRIRSINTTKKITSAMELISIGKLRHQRDLYDDNKNYALSLKDTVFEILSNTHDVENRFLLEREDTNPLTIVFLSDLGLCGGYNTNMSRYIMETVEKKGSLVIIGSRGRGLLLDNGYQIDRDIFSSDTMNYSDLFKLATRIIDDYISEKITSINIGYTKYINSMNFEPTIVKLLPVDAVNKTKTMTKEIIYEPDANTILDELIPLYIKSLLYSYWLETTTSEHSARRLAMELATDNAEELIDDLTLKYNKARQAAITQEINEIVMTSDAL